MVMPFRMPLIDYNNIMYADDLVMFSPSYNGICPMLKDCEKFAEKWFRIESN